MDLVAGDLFVRSEIDGAHLWRAPLCNLLLSSTTACGGEPHAALGTVLILLLPAKRLLIDLLGWGDKY